MLAHMVKLLSSNDAREAIVENRPAGYKRADLLNPCRVWAKHTALVNAFAFGVHEVMRTGTGKDGWYLNFPLGSPFSF